MVARGGSRFASGCQNDRGVLGATVLESNLVRQIMRWDMVVLRESPWYQEILQQGQTQVVSTPG